MAPVSSLTDLPGLEGFSLVQESNDNANTDTTSLMDTLKTLTTRSDPTQTASPGHGAVNPNTINMQAILAVFALIGAGFVLAAIWFFFWAKNGGFVWRKGDWEEYKSTVLRRKGPDGKTLSNATKSTRLGGGSVVGRGYSDRDDRYTVTNVDEEASVVTREKPTKDEEKQSKKLKKNFRETAKEKLLRSRKEEKWEGEGDADVRAYRHERPARVGGINRNPDGTYYGTEYTTSTHPEQSTYSDMEHQPQDVVDGHRQRNVSGFSFTAGSEDVLSQATEEHQFRNPAMKRDSSHQEQRPGHQPRQPSPRKRDRERISMPGGYTEPLDFSSRGSNSEYQYSTLETDDGTGTRSYHHPLPGLTKGYRREGGHGKRRDSLSDSDG
jgi:hypothetical protein